MAKKKRFNYDGLIVKKGDSICDAKDKNSKLITKIKKAEREISQLRTEIKTIQDAWDKTEVFLDDFMGENTLFDLIDQAKDGKLIKVKEIKKSSTACNDCGSKNFKVLVFDLFTIRLCKDCNYREKVENNKSRKGKENTRKGKRNES